MPIYPQRIAAHLRSEGATEGCEHADCLHENDKNAKTRRTLGAIVHACVDMSSNTVLSSSLWPANAANRSLGYLQFRYTVGVQHAHASVGHGTRRGYPARHFPEGAVNSGEQMIRPGEPSISLGEQPLRLIRPSISLGEGKIRLIQWSIGSTERIVRLIQRSIRLGKWKILPGE